MRSPLLARSLASLLLAAVLPFAGALSSRASHAGARTMSNTTLHSFEVRTNEGRKQSLARFKGKAVLVVNTASRCGLTPQYEGLETLYEKYKAQGFEILAFPANDFLGQEPGTDEEIREFCSTKYDISFPLFSKIHVKGKEQAPLYRWLTNEAGHDGEIEWNFAKFLVGPDGRVVARFAPKVKPLDPQVTGAIDSLLASRPAR